MIHQFAVGELSEDFINDCLQNLELRIVVDFLEVFNTEFKALDKDSYEAVFEDESDVHYKYFRYIVSDNLSQESLDVFETKLLELLKNENIINEQSWNILKIYDSNNSNLSIINTFKNILDKILNSNIVLNIERAKILIPYFIKYKLLNGKLDVFRLVLKNDFLSDSIFIKLLINNSDYFKEIYRNSSHEDKEGFRNLVNEKRADILEFEDLAKALHIRRSSLEKSEEN